MSSYSAAVEKADALFSKGTIDAAQFRSIVAADARYHIEEARAERDEALALLEKAASPDAKAAEADDDAAGDAPPPPATVSPPGTDVTWAPEEADPATPPQAGVRFDVDAPLATIRESGSEASRSTVRSSGTARLEGQPVAATPALKNRSRGALAPNLPVSRRIGGEQPPPKKGLLSRFVRGVSRKMAGRPKPVKAWEAAANASAAAKAPPPKPARRGSRSRLSEQPFSPADFERLRTVGRGGFGVVYLVRKRQTPNQDRLYAMKVLDKTVVLRGGGRAQARLERDVLRILKHPFVARLRYAFQTETRLYLLTDLYCAGCLTDFLADLRERGAVAAHGGLRASSARFYAAELQLALAHLHARGVVHRDVKPSNVLVDRFGHVALCDFGIAAVCAERFSEDSGKKVEINPKTPATPRRRSFCGTVEYMAPELLRGEAYSHAVDWWALGVVFHELVTGQTPFGSRRPREMFAAILRADPPPLPEAAGDDAASLAAGLLRKKADERLGAADEVKDHAFFASVDWAQLESRRTKPPHAPRLPPYFSFTPAGVLECTEPGPLPKLDADGESDESDDERAKSRKKHGVARPDAFEGFAYAGDGTP